jgi:hypothetical protein
VVISLRWQPHETAGDVLAAVGDLERVQNMHDERDEVLESTLAGLAARHSGVLGVAARNLTTGAQVLLRADEVFPTASVIKLPILVELMRRAANGRASLDELGLPSVRLHHRVDFEVIGDDVRRLPRPNARARQRAERRP